MAVVVVGEVQGIAAIANNAELHEAKQGVSVAVAGIVLVIDNLLHGPAGTEVQGLELDLYDRHTIDKQDHIVAMVANVSVDAQLVDHFESVLAPVLDVNEGVKERCAVVPLKAIKLTKMLGSGKHIGCDNLIKQTGELGIG